MIFTAKKKSYTRKIIQVQALRRKPKRLRLFSHKASTEVKKTVSVITSCRKTFGET